MQIAFPSLLTLPQPFKTRLLLLWDILRWLGIAFLLFIGPSYEPLSDASTVSGYYGPGAFVAWLTTAIVTLVNGEVRIALLSPRRIDPQPLKLPTCTNHCYTMGEYLDFKGPCEQCQQADEFSDPRITVGKNLKRLSLNVNFIATILYPIIATIDLLNHWRTRPNGRDSGFSEVITNARVEAGIIVLQTWMALSWISLPISVCYAPWLSIWRVMIWIMTSFTLFLIWIFTFYWNEKTSNLFLKDLICVLLGISSCTIHRQRDSPKRYLYDGFFLVMLSFAVGFLFWRSKPDCPIMVRLPGPDSGAELTDLDQIASLVTAAVLFVWEVYPAARSTVTRLLSHITSQDVQS
jgi:hypothetical protein